MTRRDLQGHCIYDGSGSSGKIINEHGLKWMHLVTRQTKSCSMPPRQLRLVTMGTKPNFDCITRLMAAHREIHLLFCTLNLSRTNITVQNALLLTAKRLTISILPLQSEDKLKEYTIVWRCSTCSSIYKSTRDLRDWNSLVSHQREASYQWTQLVQGESLVPTRAYDRTPDAFSGGV